MSMQMDSQLTT